MIMNNYSNQNYLYINCIRALATVQVVFAHIRIGDGSFTGDSQFAHIISLFSHCSVPLFVMITGVLFLTRSKPIDKVKHMKRIIHLVLVTMFWCFLYNIISLIVIERSFNLFILLKSIWMAIIGDTTFAYQLWYMYMVIGLYLILPVIRKYFDDASRKEMKCWLLILFIFGLLEPTLQEIFDYHVPVWGNAFCYFYGFLVYLVLGAYLHRFDISIRVKITVFATWLLQLGIIVTSIVLRNDSLPALHPFCSPFMAETATLIFLFYKKYGERILQLKILHKVIMVLATYSFQIYILHPMIIVALNKLFSINTSFAPYLISSFSLVTFVICFCLIAGWIMKKIPLLNRLF